MDALKKRRSSIKGKSTRLHNIVLTKDENNELELEEIAIYTDQLNDIWTELNEVHSDIIVLCKTDEEIKTNEQEYDEIATKIEFLKIKTAKIKKIKLKQESNSTNSVSENEDVSMNKCSPATSINLPRIDLPSFSGNFTEWLSFRDIFTATIHDNPSLSNVQKLQYLKLSLKHHAATLVKSIQITNDNYKKAWELICNRYENKSEIITATLDKLFSQPTLNQESANGLRNLLDTTTQCLDTLEILQQPVEHWDTILIHILRRKLDSETLRYWTLSLSRGELPTFQEFRSFIENRASALSSLYQNKVRPSGAPHKQSLVKEPRSNFFSSAHHITTYSCLYCRSNAHSIYKCQDFEKLSVEERGEVIKKNKLCTNCLKRHSSAVCTSKGCRIWGCNKKHHTLLHVHETKPETGSSDTLSNLATESVVYSHFSESNNYKQIILPTCIFKVIDSQGKPQLCRGLIDCGSQSSFITEQCFQKLGVKRKNNKIKITGISHKNSSTSNGIVNLNVISCFDANAILNADMHILPKITCDLPQNTINTKNLECFNLLKLADPNYFEPSVIDILLGADVCPDVFLNGRIKAPQGGIVAQETIFGWIIFGNAEPMKDVKQTISVNHSIIELDVPLQKFWELEEVPQVSPFTKEETQCLTHFDITHSRDNSGMYIVKLPFKEDVRPLGASRDIAISRFLQLERKFRNQSALREHYIEFMREYIELGHMEEIPLHDIDIPTESICYIPHHSVAKTQNTAGKFRVVFDASAKTASGVSLNDNLLVGPTLQDNIFQLILRFREHPIVITADIAKMYRQVKINKPDADFQRIVWRPSPTEPIKDYRLKTVTYGTASAPFLATKCLQQLAADDGEQYPLAAKALVKDFYVDDLMSGAATVKDALELQSQLVSLLKGGGFELRKWSSNHPALLQAVPETLREVNAPQQIKTDDAVKTLGVLWHPQADDFSFKIMLDAERETVTKRSLLSTVAKIFDPLGWLTPVSVTGKILLQELWKTKVNWDDPLPDEFIVRWITFRENLRALRDLRIPRFISTECPIHHELHGFCDASERAFAASVYLRTIDNIHGVTVKLVTAKSKVAPLKSLSLPRLELCGAHLLSKLMKAVKESSNLSFRQTHCWTDSTIVMSWLKSHSSRWKTFVANRVAQIHELLPETAWHHISSENNPADCASRGIMSHDLITHRLWWNGPDILHAPGQVTDLGAFIDEPDEVFVEERKASVNSTIVTETKETNNKFDLLHRFSTLSKLKRITAYCFRFAANCKQPPDKRNLGFLTTLELHHALLFWVKIVQNQEFSREITSLKVSKSISTKSKLLPLNPFIDDNGLLRVGGRLRHANLNENHKHPILLPKKHRLTELIIMHFHLTNLHAGPQLLQACIQQQFWIISARSVIRQLIRKCVTCARTRAETLNQIMGDLPTTRVNPARPFLECGVDYAGPFFLRISKGRSNKTFKAYIALFVCFATRAIHLELVSDLSSEGFIASLKRFIARRGMCHTIHSDCGSNFVGANRELKIILQNVRSKQHTDKVSHFLSDEGINWKFNPPSSPHMGGLWEAGIKSVKYHLKRIIGNNLLTYEEMYTIIVQVEACLNSRPLCPMSNDPNDLSALTPGHFLIGDALTALPDVDLTSSKPNRINRWQLLQKLTQHFWKRWVAEYLSHLQQRPKWTTKQKNVEIGNLVLLKDERLPPLKWKLGRIVQLFPGTDGLIRTVTVRTADGLLKRTIQKLCLLPIDRD